MPTSMWIDGKLEEGRLEIRPKGAEPKLSDFQLNDRVELHPATDLWTRGARFGTVTKIGRKLLTVKVDALGRSVWIAPRNIYSNHSWT